MWSMELLKEFVFKSEKLFCLSKYPTPLSAQINVYSEFVNFIDFRVCNLLQEIVCIFFNLLSLISKISIWLFVVPANNFPSGLKLQQVYLESVEESVL